MSPAAGTIPRTLGCQLLCSMRLSSQGARAGLDRTEALVPVALFVLLLRVLQRLLQLIAHRSRVLFLHLGFQRRNAFLAVRLVIGPRSNRDEEKRNEGHNEESIPHGSPRVRVKAAGRRVSVVHAA